MINLLFILITLFPLGNYVESNNKNETSSYVATAYCLKGRTASGKSVRRGIVAADRRLHRLGSKIFIFNAGNYSGQYHVEDTGGDIKGNRLDIWMASCSEARRFGVKRVLVIK